MMNILRNTFLLHIQLFSASTDQKPIEIAIDIVSTEECGMWMDIRINCKLVDGYVDSGRARYIYLRIFVYLALFNKKISALPRNYVDKNKKTKKKKRKKTQLKIWCLSNHKCEEIEGENSILKKMVPDTSFIVRIRTGKKAERWRRHLKLQAFGWKK